MLTEREAPGPVVRNLARAYGGLWIVADMVNLWKVLASVMTIQNPYQRAGSVMVGLIVVPLVFYYALQVVALRLRIRRSLNILLVASFLPVLIRGIVLEELVLWVVLSLLPNRALASAFSKWQTPAAGRTAG